MNSLKQIIVFIKFFNGPSRLHSFQWISIPNQLYLFYTFLIHIAALANYMINSISIQSAFAIILIWGHEIIACVYLPCSIDDYISEPLFRFHFNNYVINDWLPLK